MKEKLKKMTIAELQARAEELRGIGENPENRTTEELESLAEERNAIDEELNERRQAAARAALRREQIASGAAETTPVARMAGNGAENRPARDAGSEEYRRAWLKNLAVRDGVNLFGEMTPEERDAFTFTTANTGAVVPTAVMNRIVELVESNYPIYADAEKSSMTSGFQIPRHKAIIQGDAAATAEGAANADEQDQFDFLPMAGVEIKKHLTISRKMKWQSIEAFQDWVETHIAERIGVAKEQRILAQLNDATYGIAAGNVMASVQATDAGVRSVLAKIKGQGAKVWYANANTIWDKLAGIEDGAGYKAFLPSPREDPIVQGRIYGSSVKLDDNLADNVAYVGIPTKILANNFEELFMHHAIDPKTVDDIVTGYSLFDAGLENPLSFVKVTFQ